jgi:hypothetical protein
MTKAVFANGQVMAAAAGSLTLGFPNQVYVDRGAQKQAEAEEALAAAVGSPIRVQLVVGGDEGRAASRTAAPDEEDAGDPVEDIDLDTLVDAPKETRSGIDRVTEAFPGAQIVDH